VSAGRKRKDAPTSDDERASGLDPVLGLALAIARLHKNKCVECAAAYRESDEEASIAWKADPEFGNALHLAYKMGETKPLRDFVKAGKSVPQAHVFVAGESIPLRVLVADLLGDHHQQQDQGSRPRRPASEAPATLECHSAKHIHTAQIAHVRELTENLMSRDRLTQYFARRQLMRLGPGRSE
jgi:hypothetical protein